MSSFDLGMSAYRDIMLIRNHFNRESYSYLDEKNPESISKQMISGFYKNNQIKFFEEFENKYESRSRRIWLNVALYSHGLGRSFNIIELLKSSENGIFVDWNNRVSDYNKTLKFDLGKNSIDSFDKLKMNMSFNGKNFLPNIVRLTISRKISNESFLILDNIFNLMEKYERTLEGDIMWEDFSTFQKKYKLFLTNIDRDKSIIMLKDIIRK